LLKGHDPEIFTTDYKTGSASHTLKTFQIYSSFGGTVVAEKAKFLFSWKIKYRKILFDVSAYPHPLIAYSPKTRMRICRKFVYLSTISDDFKRGSFYLKKINGPFLFLVIFKKVFSALNREKRI
jgi:hypothetical protein